ncbi:putative transcription factor interactor and regulator Znf-B family [Helianthus annuus]|nr:putative transcription factor interactor and regulator Znf-B family [Helianthus annuus]
MKIQCDVCNNNEASVYCSVDEAALCSACDHRVHHANKLAGKHPRFSLHHPPPKDTPVCDICQEKKAFLFCQQDRAILCKDCDDGIHKVNQLKQNHHRFLLTGVKLSPTASLYSSVSSPAKLPEVKSGGVVERQQKPVSFSVVNQTSVCKGTNCHQELNGSGHGPTASSISEYLIETLPGWHVGDFLDPPTSFSKNIQVGDNDPGPIWGGDLIDGSLNNSLLPESMGIWVPQAPQPAQYGHVLQQFEPGSNMGFGDQTINGSSLVFAQNNYTNINKITSVAKSSRNWIPDNANCFTVPQISPCSTTTSKRSRTLWQ